MVALGEDINNCRRLRRCYVVGCFRRTAGAAATAAAAFEKMPVEDTTAAAAVTAGAAGANTSGDTLVYEEARFPLRVDFRQRRPREGLQPAGGRGKLSTPNGSVCFEREVNDRREFRWCAGEQAKFWGSSCIRHKVGNCVCNDVTP